MQKLADIIGVSRNYLSDYLLYIEKAGMITQVRDDTGGIRGLGKIEKIYLDNTNLIYALEERIPILVISMKHSSITRCELNRILYLPKFPISK